MAALDGNLSRQHTAFRFPATAVPPSLALLLVGSIVWMYSDNALPTYVWPDVMVVYLFSALPLAAAITSWFGRHDGQVGSIVLGTAGLTLAAALAVLQPLATGTQRAAAALGLAVGLLWWASSLLSSMPRPKPPVPRPKPPVPRSGAVPLLVVGGLLMWLLPAVYVQARCRHDTQQLGELLEQSRLGEAHLLANRLLVLSPSASFQERPLHQTAAEIEAMVEQLESLVAQPLGADAGDPQRLERSRQLAILGRNSAALDLLAASTPLAGLPQTCNLRGTILETLGRWQSARAAYGMAKAAWQEQPRDLQQDAGLLKAVTGIAYCERKLGRYPQAETAYLHRLTLAPDADSHFLLAQFYEDTQQTASAQRHARRAMALAPERYRERAEQLLNKLATFHFGCLTSNDPHPPVTN